MCRKDGFKKNNIFWVFVTHRCLCYVSPIPIVTMYIEDNISVAMCFWYRRIWSYILVMYSIHTIVAIKALVLYIVLNIIQWIYYHVSLNWYLIPSPVEWFYSEMIAYGSICWTRNRLNAPPHSYTCTLLQIYLYKECLDCVVHILSHFLSEGKFTLMVLNYWFRIMNK